MNIPIPHQLIEAIKEKKLIIFIGAGVSSGVGIPAWKDIVLKTLSHPNIEKGSAFKNALENGIMTPLEVLDKLQLKNKKDVFKTFECETSNKIESPLYGKLSKLSKKFITTNYDYLIEHNTGISKIDTSSIYNLQKLDQEDSFVLKIHGCVSAIDNAVIFSTDYEELYNSATTGGMAKFQLKKIVSTHSCLFIGYSLSDHYLVELFNALNTLYDGTGREHYVITTENINHEFVESIVLPDYSHFDSLIDTLCDSVIEDEAKYDLTISEVESQHDANEFTLTLGHDTPPLIEYWAGRVEEMRALEVFHKACFITGIGGQGKSALASKFLNEVDRHNYSFCDWRDFKEEELNFQTKLYQLIELVSNNTITINSLIGLDTDVLVDKFFNTLGSKKGIFVFDNIDKYIDLQSFTPTGDMKRFFEYVLTTNHNSRFIFTCRPFIHFAGVGSYQIRLEGLKLNDVEELIAKYHHKLKRDELAHLANRLYQNTGGHPLWMGLILAQSRVDFKQIDKVLEKIERRDVSKDDSNFSTIVSATVLENLWDGLKEREKIVLRTLSICNIAESQEELAKIVAEKINHNQYTKAVRSLKSLNLLVEKEGEGYLELHPLVREFIKGKYDTREQESYIALYVRYLDKIIVLLKNNFGKILPQDDIELLIKKIEILIAAGKTQESINELRLTSESLLISGYCEEYLRLASQVLDRCTWSNKGISSISGFHEFMDVFLTNCSDFGRYDIFDKYIDKYSSIFTVADANLILIKSSQCHRYWVEGNISKAISFGKSASDLIDLLGKNDVWVGKHRYHLALRDSGNHDDINTAMQYFCEGKPLDELINEEIDTTFATHYGNIGKCYLLLENYQMALKLVCKSYEAFTLGSLSYQDLHNIGYAAKWLSEIYRTIEPTNVISLYFILYARNLWRNDMPIEANKIDAYISSLPSSAANESIISLEAWQIQKHCNDFVTNTLSSKINLDSAV
ncbi:SIR2 family protein [Enterobacter hormaechei]|uniref:SIR2 family protein n=1 Tax=Enterobacter hormaechei TaxID=158836 RepID=UPI002074A847|nr:SIR2 family protein [Enterobacter hormaechei]